CGKTSEVPAPNPVNYHQVVTRRDAMRRVVLDGKLFVPTTGAREKWPVVMIVPGSLGVAPSHVAHAETLTDNGIAAFVLDNFGGRNVTSTVANQTQFSFAASAYDVLAALKILAARPELAPR